MILESAISNVLEQQMSRILTRETGLKRELVPVMHNLTSHALIISGVRRCGKSTLILQTMKQMDPKSFLFLNFESPQLFEFSLSDFSRLDNLIAKKGIKTLFFDEMQLVNGWELYVRQKLDEDFRVIITGSNASMLSKESGTKLTGRHISQELFPFSYSEFIAYKKVSPSADSIQSYMNTGGFPEFVKSGYEEQLTTLFEDILVRDIVVRYGIKDIKSLQRLALFLIANIGNRITATKLKQPMSIGATSTITSWFSHLEESYLFFFLPAYSHSVKAQMINPRKIYAIDTGLVNAVSGLTTEDLGRKLENLIFLYLRTKEKDIYYFDQNKGECDFVVMNKGDVKKLVQVCFELTFDDIDRELKGLQQAMQFFHKRKATIVTLNNEDLIKQNGLEIEVVPAYKYLLSDY